MLEHEAEIASARARKKASPKQSLDKIVEGRLRSSRMKSVLLRQAYIRDENVKVEKLVMQNIAAIGENVIIRRFQRWELGEKLANSSFGKANRRVGLFLSQTVRI